MPELDIPKNLIGRAHIPCPWIDAITGTRREWFEIARKRISIGLAFFLVLLFSFLIYTNYSSYKNYLQSQENLQEIEARYRQLQEQIEIKEKELDALRRLISEDGL